MMIAKLLRTVLHFAVLFAFTPLAHAETSRPNVLFIAIDDLRPALGCYGDPIARTPNIDALARRSVVFHRAYCQQAVCCPSRLSLLTGLRPDTIRVWDLATHFRQAMPSAVTLPQYFKQHGYHAQSIGKILHGGGAPSKDPPSWSVPPQFDQTRDPKWRYATPANLAGSGHKRAATEMADVDDNAYVDGHVATAAAVALAERAADKKPFFLAVGFRKPHLPFCAPKRYWDLYDRDAIPLPELAATPQGAPELAVRSWKELEGYTDIPEKGPEGEPLVRRLRHGYYACASYVDAQVGRVLRALHEHGLATSTIVVLWGDHGFHLGEQGVWCKATNFEWATRVPLMIAAGAATHAPGNTQALVGLLDVYPTLCDLCGLTTPEGLEGESLLAILKQPTLPGRDFVVSQYPRDATAHRHRGRGDVMGYTLRTARFRYVEWWTTAQQRVARELYDHREDPLESRNVVHRAGYAAEVSVLESALEPYRSWRP